MKKIQLNNIRDTIFENDKTLEENVIEGLEHIGENPHKISKMFWYFRIQICIALFLLVGSILLPIRLMYGG